MVYICRWIVYDVVIDEMEIEEITMTVLTPARTSTRQLSWQAADRVYAGEISSTNGLGRVFDDACDEGLTLVSARTGREMVFMVDHVTRDEEDGTILVWTLIPVNRADRQLVTSIQLFND
jgi:hypothetical protein